MTKPAGKRSKDSGQLTPRWLAAQLIDIIRLCANPLIVAVAIVMSVYFVTNCVAAFAGRTSVANLAMEVAGRLNVTVGISVTVSIIASGLWANEIRRHRRTRERLTNRTRELELLLDEQRTSSGLPAKGTTLPGDK